MTIRVAINGFGRIGRNTTRALFESGRDDIEIVAINDLTDLKTQSHLLKYDTTHGTFGFDVSTHDEDTIIVDGKKIDVFSQRNPAQLPWKDLEVDIVFESTGFFTARDKAALHIDAGAKKVLISAPSGDADLMSVFGVNSDEIKAEHAVVSNASCTTNCLAPVAQTLNNAIGIKSGSMVTIHSYTGDQSLVDGPHGDLHRARAAAASMIPTSTGAAKAVGKVLPELAGKLDGSSVRVPTLNVSLVDFTFVASRETTVEEVNKVIQKASEGNLKGVLGTYDIPLVSSDFNHNPLSSIFALAETNVIDGNLVNVKMWYDNEWGFSNRMLDTAKVMHAVGYEGPK